MGTLCVCVCVIVEWFRCQFVVTVTNNAGDIFIICNMKTIVLNRYKLIYLYMYCFSLSEFWFDLFVVIIETVVIDSHVICSFFFRSFIADCEHPIPAYIWWNASIVYLYATFGFRVANMCYSIVFFVCRSFCWLIGLFNWYFE